MHVLVGTSGYSYKEWVGPFYPKGLPAKQYLRFYASALPTVEINNTFYRMPTRALVEGWGREVGDTFTFSLKAPQRITHIAKLVDAGQATAAFVQAAEALGGKLGPLLFQLPPFARKDVAKLDAFLTSGVPKGKLVAFEFRHASWFDDETWECLRKHGAALCVAEGESIETPLVATATWGYVRLRHNVYDDVVLDAWAKKIRAQKWDRAFVYVKHDEGDAPSVAKRLGARLS